ncbi:hypothetical protein HY494_01645, partial [Candidatus Woesearchaeota archaeon]|nr:hypothetical protein [Candidatus Woesearchaeota archaeon]
MQLKKKSRKRTMKVNVEMVLFFALLVIIAGSFLAMYGTNSITGAVVSIPSGNCYEETFCANETIITCLNETVQKCDATCVNETKETCTEECRPECRLEKINGVEREVCVKTCSMVCSTEIVQNCG